MSLSSDMQFKSRVRPSAAMVAALALVVFAAACGDDDSDEGAAPTAATAAATIASTATTTESASSAESADLAEANAILAAGQERPTTLPVTVPIGKPVPKGITVAYIPCGQIQGCIQSAEIAKEAGNLLGWTVNTISTDGSPESVNAAFAAAVLQKPDAIIYQGVTRSMFADHMADAEAAGIFVTGMSTPDAIGDGIGYTFGGPDQLAPPISELQSSAVAVDSGGSGKAVYVNVPSFAIVQPLTQMFIDKLAEMCPDCSAEGLDLALSDIGPQATQNVVAYLRAHPDVKYVALSADAFTPGLPDAMEAAGVKDVKIVGHGATAAEKQWFASGDMIYDVADPYYEQVYTMIDAIARHAADVPLLDPTKQAYPMWLVDGTTAPAEDIFPLVPDFDVQFKELWGVS